MARLPRGTWLARSAVSMARPRRILLSAWLLAAAASLAVVGGAVAPASAQELARSAEPGGELGELSAQIEGIQSALRHQLGLDRISLGGGSARAVLDAIYFGKPLDPRDVDLMVVAGRQVSASDARRIGRALERAIPGARLVGVEPRPRGNPRLPPAESQRYNAGHGIFLSIGGRRFDVSLFHQQEDLDLNGALDIDTIRLPLDRGRTLLDTFDRMRGLSYRRAVKAGLVSDPHRGYRAWQRNRLRVVHPAEIESKPALWSIRLARSYGRAGYREMPDQVVGLLRRAAAANDNQPDPELVKRYLGRLLEDPRADSELEWVVRTGLIDQGAIASHLRRPTRSARVTSRRRAMVRKRPPRPVRTPRFARGALAAGGRR